MVRILDKKLVELETVELLDLLVRSKHKAKEVGLTSVSEQIDRVYAYALSEILEDNRKELCGGITEISNSHGV